MSLGTTGHITGTNTRRAMDTHTNFGGPGLPFGVDFTDDGTHVCLCV